MIAVWRDLVALERALLLAAGVLGAVSSLLLLLALLDLAMHRPVPAHGRQAHPRPALAAPADAPDLCWAPCADRRGADRIGRL